MNRHPTPAEIHETVSCLLHRQKDVAAAYLLGSAAGGRMRADSDIDLALMPMPRRALSLQTRMDLAAQMEQQLGKTADIGIITSDNLVYAVEAILKGHRVYTRDEDYAAAMETRLLGTYLQFRNDRHEVEESYRAAG